MRVYTESYVNLLFPLLDKIWLTCDGNSLGITVRSVFSETSLENTSCFEFHITLQIQHLKQIVKMLLYA